MGSWAVALMEIIPSKQDVEEMSDTLVLLVVFSAMVRDICKERFYKKYPTKCGQVSYNENKHLNTS